MRNYKVLVGNMTNKKDHGHAAALLPKPPTTKITIFSFTTTLCSTSIVLALRAKQIKSDMRIPIG